MPDLIIDPDVQVAVTPLYRVQIAGYSLVLTDRQANDLFVQLNGLFGENPVLTERVDEIEVHLGNWATLDAQVCTLQEQMEAVRGAIEPSEPPMPLTLLIVPPGVTTNAAIALHRDSGQSDERPRPSWESPPFTPEETATVQTCSANGAPTADIAAILDRTPQSVRREIERHTPPTPAAPATAEPHTIPPGVTTKEADPRYRHGEPYTTEEYERLKSLLAAGKSNAEIAAAMGRSAQSIQSKVSGDMALFAIRQPAKAKEELALIGEATRRVREPETNPTRANRQRAWTPDDDAQLATLFHEDKTHEAIGVVLGRTRGAVSERCAALDLRRHEYPERRSPLEIATGNDRDALSHLAASGTPWRASEDLLLRSTMNQGGTLSEAALSLKRSGAEVRERWVALCKERINA